MPITKKAVGNGLLIGKGKNWSNASLNMWLLIHHASCQNDISSKIAIFCLVSDHKKAIFLLLNRRCRIFNDGKFPFKLFQHLISKLIDRAAILFKSWNILHFS